MSKTYTNKSNAKRAAEAALKAAPAGSTYEVNGEGNSWTFTITEGPAQAAHDPAETIKQGHAEDAAAAAGTEPQAQAEVHVPFSYLPAAREQIVEVLRNDLTTETKELIYRVLNDAGIPVSEIRGMAREVVEEHVLRVIAEDRAAFLKDHGKSLPEAVREELKATVDSTKGKKAAKKAKEPKAPKTNAAPADRRQSSDIESPVKRVWAIADKFLKEVGGDLSKMVRKVVLKACDDEGIAFYTARTQYQRWFTAQKESAANLAAAKAAHATK